MGSSPVILDAVVIPLIRGPRILDVGCGFGRWGSLINTNYWETCSKDTSAKPEVVGCEGYLPNVEMARNSGFYEEVIHLRFPPLPFENSSFDTVLLLDVIEHLENGEGLDLVQEAKRVASDRVILSTPNYYAIRDAHATMTGWNPLEAHLSYWPRSYLRGIGFRLYGAGCRRGGRYWRAGLMKTNLLSLYDRIIRPSIGSTSFYSPFISENLVGVWDKEEDR